MISRLLGRVGPQRLVRLALGARPGSDLIVHNGRRWTRRQIHARLMALAAGLRRLGIRKGDHVATLLPACPEAILTTLLPQVLGTVHVPLNPLLGEYELRHVLADSGARIVIAAERWLGQDDVALLTRLRPDLPALERVLVRKTNGAAPRSTPTQPPDDRSRAVFLPLDDVMSGEARTRCRWERLRPDDVVLISYTSGSTGQPKGAVHTQARYWGLAMRAASARMSLSHLRCLLLPFPPYHYAGIFGAVATLLAGGSVVMLERFDPHAALELIARHGVTQTAGSPTMCRWMLRAAERGQHDLSSVRRVTLGTEPCDPEVATALHARFGCPLENMYGTTESMIISWSGPHDTPEQVAASVGFAAPGVRLRVVDAERHPLPPGERGEVVVHTSQMMSGYYGAPQAAAAVLDHSGWFHTGDEGYLEKDGRLHLAGRVRDVINRGGDKVYPAEVEHYIERHVAVRRAGVVGIRDALGNTQVVAYIERLPGAALTARGVLDHCRGQIAPQKIPTEVRFVERLPVTANGKLRRHALRALAAEETPAQ